MSKLNLRKLERGAQSVTPGPWIRKNDTVFRAKAMSDEKALFFSNDEYDAEYVANNSPDNAQVLYAALRRAVGALSDYYNHWHDEEYELGLGERCTACEALADIKAKIDFGAGDE